MNRTAILLLALAMLLAHMVAIHQSPEGEFAPPYDVAHVAFRLGRNLVHDSGLAWNRGGETFSSYPSLLWVGVCALAERTYTSPILVTQGLGMLCALGTILVVTRFSAGRRAGLIAPLLLASSGTVAAAGTSGTEAAVSMLMLTLVVLGFEHRRPLLQLLSGTLLATTQPAATWPIVMLFLLEFVDRPRDAEGRARPRALLPAVAPIAVLAALVALRRFVTGTWTTPTAASLLADPLGQLPLGLAYLEGFFLSSGSAPLLVVPLLLFSLKAEAGPSRRALLVTLSWFLGVALTGGSELPFWNALAPVLPVAFLSIQLAVMRLMDGSRATEPVVLGALVLSSTASFAVSKVPGALGPLDVEATHREWMTPSDSLREVYGVAHGRLGLLDEIRRVQRLRKLGVTLRDELAVSSSIATAWPGAIGYLSRRPVHDLLGRTDPAPGRERTLPWTGSHEVDLEASLLRGDDVIASVRLAPVLGEDEEHGQGLRGWLGRPGRFGPDQLDEAALERLLEQYEPVSIPVFRENDFSVPEPAPARLLRRRELELGPRVELQRAGGAVRVIARHDGPPQVVDVAVRFRGEDGRMHELRPNGAWVEPVGAGPHVRARTDLLLLRTGARAVRLLEFTVPPAFGPGLAEVQLLDWGGAGEEDRVVSEPVSTAW